MDYRLSRSFMVIMMGWSAVKEDVLKWRGQHDTIVKHKGSSAEKDWYWMYLADVKFKRHKVVYNQLSELWPNNSFLN